MKLELVVEKVGFFEVGGGGVCARHIFAFVHHTVEEDARDGPVL